MYAEKGRFRPFQLPVARLEYYRLNLWPDLSIDTTTLNSFDAAATVAASFERWFSFMSLVRNLTIPLSHLFIAIALTAMVAAQQAIPGSSLE